MMSPTQLSLRHLRGEGYIAAITEKWNPHAKVRQDLYGIIDVLGVGNGETIGIQCTSYPNIASRVNKITDSEVLPELREAGWIIAVHGWRKVKNRWQVKIVDIS